VADLIAAGEVVERPASVVKELMENSIDAGAGIITVEISAGGMIFIRVTDNGCGIAPEDARTAFLRHATSKLRDAGGLEAIGSLGFRGEALAAIAAVSRIELRTREAGAREGVALSLEAGEVGDMSPAGCPEGTTIIVRDLFFNTPARLKFMKTDRAESSAVAAAVLRCALSHPETSVRFIRDGKAEYHTPGDSRADSCIYSLFGREFAAGLAEAFSSDETLAVRGFVSLPAAARGNRSYQFFFVNGRPVQSRTLQAALEQAYANMLPQGRFPSCVLYLATRLGDVDVNVHPAKTEVKFVSDKQVFDGVYYAALSALHALGAAGGGREPGGADTGTDTGARGPVAAWGADTGARGPGYPKARYNASGGGFKTMQAEEFQRAYSPSGKYEPFNTAGRQQRQSIDAQLPIPGAELSGLGSSLDPPPDSTLGPPYSGAGSQFPPANYRVIGEALNTYIAVECRGSLWLIDKHAAHERIHFDALKNEPFSPMSQALITPVVCRHGPDDTALLLENEALLDKLGFSVESFGEDAVAVRRIPSEIDIGDAEPVLSDICEELKRGGAAEPARLDNIYRIIACKAAIKAGRSSGMSEMDALAARVMSGEISVCPHGRPVAYEIAKATLEKWFGRT